MSNDGFPVRKLMGADGSKSIEDLEDKNLENLVREELSLPETKVVTSSHELSNAFARGIDACRRVRRRRRVVFGDPYMVEDATAEYKQTYYLGSSVEKPHWEELILLKAKDGAIGMLYHFESIYFWGTG